jgi:hypothetical protein
MESLGGITEEYGLWEGSLITRAELDDAAVMREGRSMATHGARLEVRHLTSGALIIAGVRSPIHARQFDRELREFLPALVSGVLELEGFVERVEQLERTDVDF